MKNYLIRISKNELLDPSANICAGIRWLFRKKETASSRLSREATWFEAIEDYKSVLKKRLGKEKYNLELMKKFYEYYKPQLFYENIMFQFYRNHYYSKSSNAQ